MRVRIGSRGSALALAQTNEVARALTARGHDVGIEVIQTAGDRHAEREFADIGAPGVFVREIEAALLSGAIDVAVHSYKDLPSECPAGLVVAAVPERLDPADRLLARPEAASSDAAGNGVPLGDGVIVGTASERRRAWLRALRPDLRLETIRGNVPTRLDKLRQGPYQAVILAGAGLERLERDAESADLRLDELVNVRLDPETFVPAPAQGAIALQCRGEDPARGVLEALHNADVGRPLLAERELLRLVAGGCDLPFGAWCRKIDGDELELVAALEHEGRVVRVSERGTHPTTLADRAWDQLGARISADVASAPELGG